MSQVENYLAKQKEAATNDEELSEKWNRLENLYRKKLWHQLTEEVSDMVFNGKILEKVDPVDFYKVVLHDFEHRINPVARTRLVLEVSRNIKDPEEALKFLEMAKKYGDKNSKEAAVLCLLGDAECYLRIRSADNSCPQVAKVRELVEEAQSKLDDLPGVTAVHGEFYRISSDYMRQIADHSGYYQEALRYLGCIDASTLTKEQQVDHALCLSFAALLGKNVYNFGELLAHPILTSLDSAEPWLVELLRAFNAGDLQAFERLKPKWSKQNDLVKNEPLLREKIRLLCLMEMAYMRPANKRQISFEEISTTAKVATGEVEHLVMRALSLGLVKGFIDQVDKLVNLTWVQPRVLDRKQIGDMAGRLQMWYHEVQSMHGIVDHTADEILTR